jgi:hypothetical protein
MRGNILGGKSRNRRPLGERGAWVKDNIEMDFSD